MFSKKIIKWYRAHKRDLPWRDTKDPYKIWLSEIILQQTRVAQGLPYFEAFITRFPDVRTLAEAEEEEVLKLWQGLGYYSRARNLHASARYIQNTLKGNFPASYKDLLNLKGVGAYTAAAVASFAFNEAVPAIDGNVNRVLSRYFGVHIPVDSAKGKQIIKDLANAIIDRKQPALFNQALMEFGALQCVPGMPDCASCPLSGSCVALEKGVILELPVKKAKLRIERRYFNYIVIDNAGETLLQKRTAKGIWRNLYEFPLIESEKALDFRELLRQDLLLHLFKNSDFEVTRYNVKPIVHKLSHRHLYIWFWIFNTADVNLANMLSWEEALQFPVPVVIQQFLESYIIQKKS